MHDLVCSKTGDFSRDHRINIRTIKKLSLLASLIASLPLISVLGMIWMYAEKLKIQKIASHAEGTFLVCITLTLDVFTSALDVKKESHFASLGAGIALTEYFIF